MTDETVTLTRPELKALLTQAAHDGAKQALADIGLGDEFAGQDVRDLRGLMSAWRIGKKTAFKTIVSNITNLLFLALLLGVALKLGIKFGGG